MTSPSPALADLARAYGVATEYWDWQGTRVIVTAESIRAVLAALGVSVDTDEAAQAALRDVEVRSWRRAVPPFTLVHAGQGTRIAAHVPHGNALRVWVELEGAAGRRAVTQLDVWVDPREVDGALVGEATFELPADLPLGWHTLYAETPGADGAAEVVTGKVVVVPERLHLPPAVDRAGALGIAAQIYAVRSRRSWGVGDFTDLADLAIWSARDLGADYVLLNPVHAAEPVAPMEPSPYLPTSRRFVNPLYIRVEDVPEVAYLDVADRARVAELAGPARALNDEDTIDRDTAWTAKRAALRILFEAETNIGRRLAFEAFCEREGQTLIDFATWCVLYEAQGRTAAEWDPAFSDPRSPQVAAFREAHDRDVLFTMWLQWVVDGQLASVQRQARAAGMTLGVMTDLAVGVHPEGADAWSLGDALARGVTVGAPPDPYNQLGQDWSQPPWRPDRLRELAYRPFRDMIRAALRHAGGLRIDHVIGLFRLWWVPAGGPATGGTYVRLDHEALVGILVLEAHRAGAVIVGEDLGTVEPWVRDYLARRGILGTSILWFERDEHGPRQPEHYRRLCLASVTTHDLPPTAGYLTGEHIRVREELGVLTRPVEVEEAEDERERGEMLDALRRRGLLDELPADQARSDDAVEPDLDRIAEGLYRYLSWSPALLVALAVPDLVGDRRILNQPGTSVEYPNWRLPLAGPDRAPLLLEDLTASRWARRLGRCVQRGGR